MKKRNVCILGAAGRDFHNFLVKYKDDKNYDVKFFTAAQIPGIEKRKFPKELAGKLYEKDIPIYLENDLPRLIRKYKIDDVVFSYSDIKHEEVMHKASIAISCGANFVLLGNKETMIKSKKKVIAICAVRTGAGKSPVSRRIAEILLKHKKKVVAVRHPMPYGDLLKQKIQRFANYKDLQKHNVTIEEREEYEPWIQLKVPIYAGVDYKAILRKAEEEADVILWDGGNNDTPFYVPNLHIVVADPHRAGHELLYHPGETNLRMADVIIINKIDTAKKENIKTVESNAKLVNPTSIIIKAKSLITLPFLKGLAGKKAVVIEDGPTLTHGGMTYGAGYLAAKRYKTKIISPARYAVGSIKDIYRKFKSLKNVLPAMGYGEKQIHELEETINKCKCDVVINGSPIRISRFLKINKPIIKIDYYIKEKNITLERVMMQRGFI